MIENLMVFSIRNKLVIGLITIVLVITGSYSLTQLPIDAVPDITDNQVQVITTAPELSAQEVEQLITFPLEMRMGYIPGVQSIRSISRFGLSVITIVFEEDIDVYWAREQINQKITSARRDIPEELGVPELGPLSTGLGEIYQYTIHPDTGYEDVYDNYDLRTIQDWIIKRQLIGIPGVVEVNSSGGFLKQYEISVTQDDLKAYGISLNELFDAVSKTNENVGGSYIEKEDYTYFIRGEGIVTSIEDLNKTVLKQVAGTPVLLQNVAKVEKSSAPRFGAMTMNGRGEVVGGQVMMLKGANSMEVVRRVKERIEEIKPSLPEGIVLEPYLDRSKLVNRTTRTVATNLIEGALIVIFILVLLLGNLRAGLIVASVIPLSMLFAIIMMRIFGVSANLMSLGALDFGLIVDGAVIIVESVLHRLGIKQKASLSSREKEEEITTAAKSIFKPAAFGEVIILIVYIPILFLYGIEGKMFIPMAQTVSFAILGAILLSLTYVPMMSALLLKNSRINEQSISYKIMRIIYSAYRPILAFALRWRYEVLLVTVALFALSIWRLGRMGGEFIPTLEEGDFALHQILPTGSSLQKGIEVSAHLQTILLKKFPEVEQVVTKIGTAEIPTDIMPLEAGDIYVILKPKSEWTTARTREEMFEAMERELDRFPGVYYEFTQPIQMRFNELMTGVRQDIAIMIYGEDLGPLAQYAARVEDLLSTIDGVGDVKVESTTGLQQIVIKYDRSSMAKFGIHVADANRIVRTAFAGRTAGKFYEGERRFDIVVRLSEADRTDIESLQRLTLTTHEGRLVPLSEIASIAFEEGPSQISRHDTKRRIAIGVNARNRDIASLISEIESRLTKDLALPAGYYIRYGGQFENLERARRTLSMVVPVALGLIFILLYFAFRSVGLSMLIFTAIPLSAIGGIWSLYLRGMPFSISAGVGFIALFGVAVLNGVVLISAFNDLKNSGMQNIMDIINAGTKLRMRPVLLTASVASLGFLPMALSNTAGAEVQRPLATVVIGGLITATFLTMFVLPILYSLYHTIHLKRATAKLTPLLLITGISCTLPAQSQVLPLETFLDSFWEANELEDMYTLKMKSLEQLKSNPVLPQPYSIGIRGEEFNFTQPKGIYSLDVSKSFYSPSVPKAYSNWYDAQMGMGRAQYESDKLEIQALLVNEYLGAVLLQRQLLILDDQMAHLERLTEVLKKRVQVGDEGGLLLEVIQNDANMLEIERRSLHEYFLNLIHNLEEWSGIYAIELPPAPVLDEAETASTEINAHPLLQTVDSRMGLVEGQYQIQKSTQAPLWRGGASLQSVGGDILFFGFQLGISIPLNKSYLQNKRTASDLELASIQKEREWYVRLLSMRAQRIVGELSAIETEIASIEDVSLPGLEQLIQRVELAFRYGEAGIAELKQTFTSYATNKHRLAELQNERLMRIYKLKYHLY